MYEILKRQGVLPLITQIDSHIAKIVLQAAADSGIKAIEYAARSEDSKRVFEEMIAFKQENKLDIKICVGSMLSVEQAKLYHSLGADCIVCPHTDPDIGAYCIENKVYWIPGAATLNEVLNANKLGADIVKLFPADEIGGASYVKAIRAPFPNLKLMPTGGVTLDLENLRKWFSAGVICVGVGSHLFSKKELVTLTYDTALSKFKNLIAVIEEARN